MKKMLFILFLVSQPVTAHHTKEHTMMTELNDKIVAQTKQGADSSTATFIWLGIALALGLGVIKMLKKK